MTAVNERGNELHAEGECVNRLMVFLNENLCGWNSLVRWDIDGMEAWGEHHDNFERVRNAPLRPRPHVRRAVLSAPPELEP